MLEKIKSQNKEYENKENAVYDNVVGPCIILKLNYWIVIAKLIYIAGQN